MAHKRVLRAGEAIRRELSFILDRNVADPRIGMVTITRVEMSEDLRYAKVFVSFLVDKEERERSLLYLRKARRFIRGELAHSLRLRIAPELTFHLDDSSENYIRIAEVLKRVKEDDSEGRSEGSDDDGGGESQEGGPDA